MRDGSIEHLGRGDLADGVESDRVWDDALARRCAGAHRAGRLNSPPAILHRGDHAADRARSRAWSRTRAARAVAYRTLDNANLAHRESTWLQ